MSMLIISSVCLFVAVLLVLLLKGRASRKRKINTVSKLAEICPLSYYPPPQYEPLRYEPLCAQSQASPRVIRDNIIAKSEPHGFSFHEPREYLSSKTEPFDAPSDDLATQSPISTFTADVITDAFSSNDSPSTDTSGSSDSFSGGGDFGGGGASSDW